jgi:uncharacterized protein
MSEWKPTFTALPTQIDAISDSLDLQAHRRTSLPGHCPPHLKNIHIARHYLGHHSQSNIFIYSPTQITKMEPNRSSLYVANVPVQNKHKELFKATSEFVRAYMSQPGHDNSHDYHHILRVVSNTNRILEAEIKANSSASYDTSALFLAALLHDVGDRKYAKSDEDVENQIFKVLMERGADKDMASKVQSIVKNVSYSHEVRNPEAVVSTLQKYPELAIVQDADRLDAIGAVGVARCFSFGAAKYPDQPMSRAIDHFEEKLYKLSDMMKTDSGKAMAQRRKKLLVDFAREFEEESALSFVVE